MQAVEKYCQENDVKYLWEEKTNNVNKIYECIINIYFKLTRYVTMHVYFSTGIIMVKGLQYKDWITNEFVKVKAFMNNILATTTMNMDKSDVKLNNNHNEWQKEIDKVNRDGESLKTSLETIETSMITSNVENEKLKKNIEKRIKDLEELYIKNEKLYDTKLEVFQAELEKITIINS